MKKLVALFAGIAAMFAVSCSLTPATPGDAVVEIYQMIIDGQYEAAAARFYVDKENPADVEEFRSFLTSLFTEKLAPKLQEKGGISNVEILSETLSEDGKTAKVSVKLTYGNGTEETEDIDMVYTEAGEWMAAINK